MNKIGSIDRGYNNKAEYNGGNYYYLSCLSQGQEFSHIARHTDIQSAIKIKNNSRGRKKDTIPETRRLKCRKLIFLNGRPALAITSDDWFQKLFSPVSKECLENIFYGIKIENMVKEIILKVSLYNWLSITVT